MAKRNVPAESIDSDRIAGFSHPRSTFTFGGQDVSLWRAARALWTGTLPCAWLISGPPGVGKATLAYRIARYLMAHGATTEGPEDLSVPFTAAAARQTMAQSHPGLLALRRAGNPRTGKLMTVLAVD